MKPIPVGYSGTSLIKKIVVKEEMKNLLIHKQNENFDLLGPAFVVQKKKNEMPLLFSFPIKLFSLIESAMK